VKGPVVKQLEGKTAFVTGGDSGIGLGIAAALAEAGMTVIICGLAEERLMSARQQLAGSGDAHYVVLDVTDRDSFADVADRVDSEFGGIDVLVNNAGVGFLVPALEASFEQWDWVLRTNLTGVFNGIRTFVPRMLSRGGPGHVVATASIGGMLGAPGAVYAAAKSGVIGLMESLALELRETPIGVSMLIPGIVRTQILDGPPPPGPARQPTPGGTSQAELYAAAMEPREVGQRVLDAIRRQDLYIFTHAEHREMLTRRFGAILRAVPEEEVDPRRAATERTVLHNPLYDEVRSAADGGGSS
jgi:NAD(P)-dependent dehydrogenase (short-subunit alcohol dehydrogenase family)